ncbi:hypothetical protein, partial [Acinetobacter baumannii]|uniref:hypothetical protein n=1 Tax=Acinetobacter baumannii TaxID=470 RepID=UPI002244F7D0
CMGQPREGATAHAENYPEGANGALRAFGADLSMVDAIPDEVDLVHSHTWYTNLAGLLAGVFHDVPHVISVVRNGVNTDEFYPVTETDVCRDIGMDPDRPSVVFVGRITRQKGLVHLVHA